MKRLWEWFRRTPPSAFFSTHDPEHVRMFFAASDTETLILARQAIDNILAWRQAARNTIDEMRASPTGL